MYKRLAMQIGKLWLGVLTTFVDMSRGAFASGLFLVKALKVSNNQGV